MYCLDSSPVRRARRIQASQEVPLHDTVPYEVLLRQEGTLAVGSLAGNCQVFKKIVRIGTILNAQSRTY
jgi:hypothetical protein